MAKSICRMIGDRQVCRGMPLLLNLISIFIIIAAIATIILGGIFLAGGTLLGSILSSLGLGIIGTYVAIVGGIVVAVSLFNLILGFALRQGHNWARIWLVITYSLAAIGGFIALIQGGWISIISLAIDVALILYLLLDKDVKEFFS